MMVYCYSTDCRTVERVFRMGEAPATVRLDDGTVASRDYRAERIGVPARSGWPIECLASGVNVSQADELRKFFREHGCSDVRVSADGNPVYESASQRKRALKARGLVDRNSYC